MSAVKVAEHAEELQARHAAAHGRITAAQGGVPAASAVALSAVVAKWQADSAVLTGNLSQHGGALRGADVGYTATEERSSEAINVVGAEGSTAGAGS